MPDIIHDEWSDLTDEQLAVHSLVAQPAFGVLIERYEEKMLRYVGRLTSVSAEDVEDIVQDIFIRCYQNLAAFDSSVSFSSWLYRIAHNMVVDSYRRSKARPHGNSIVLTDFEYHNLASDFDLGAVVDGALLRERIEETLKKIDVKYRDVLVLKYLEDKSYEEIGDILKKPGGSVATLLHRAKKQFMKYYSYDNA